MSESDESSSMAVRGYLPQHRPAWIFLLVLLLAAAIAWLPWLANEHLAKLKQPNDEAGSVTPVTLDIDIPFTAAELEAAGKLFGPSSEPHADFPLWTPPDDSDYGGIAIGRDLILAAIDHITNMDGRLRAGEAVDPSELDELARQTRESLDALDAEQGTDRMRGAHAYYLGLLAVWRGEYDDAHKSFSHWEANTRDFLKTVGRGDTNGKARLRGQLTMALYGRGHSLLAMAGLDKDKLDEAIKVLRDAREAAKSPRGGVGAIDTLIATEDPESDLNNLVQWDTAPIWNDLLVALMRNGDYQGAYKEAEPLMTDLGLNQVRRVSPELASNLLVLKVLTEANGTLEQRLADADRIWPDRMWSSRISDGARARAHAVFAMLGRTKWPAAMSETGEETLIRQTFAAEKNGWPGFPQVTLPGVATSGQTIDGWLYIQKWRNDLSIGRLDQFCSSYATINATPNLKGFDFSLLRGWREAVLPRALDAVDAASRGPLPGEAQREQLFRARVGGCDVNLLSSYRESLRFAAGDAVWLLEVGWIVGIALVLLLWCLAFVYWAHFTPAHHKARRKAERKRGQAEG